jgi:glycosyltransferase involved in cell wall biosynthesis
MKVLHVPFTFHPDPVGGTEVYVDTLARCQQDRGMDVAIVAPGPRAAAYRRGDLSVFRVPVSNSVTDLRDQYGLGDAVPAACFGEILHREQPDVVHLHAFTPAVSLLLLREAKRRGVPLVFSYHTPTVSCQRGSLLHWGADVCDGTLDVTACTQCSLHGLGLNRAFSRVAASIPPGVGRAVGALGISGGVWTAVRMTELIGLRQAAFRALMDDVDHIVALCDWVRQLLLRNGVAPGKITVSRQGIDLRTGHTAPERPRIVEDGSPVRIVFAGRLDPTKGAHVLIDAFNAAQDLPAELHIYGIVQEARNEKYLRRLQAMAGGDRRISFHPPVRPEAIVGQMREYDVVAVPSQWLETGPMVVMEAFAAGVPVIGSDLGGLAELITHGVDGLLVPFRSAEAWRRTLESLCRTPQLLTRLRAGIREPRRTSDVANEMSSVYAAVVRAASWRQRHAGSRSGFPEPHDTRRPC